MIEAFSEFMDGLFYEGYTAQLAIENYELYTFELIQFLNNYNLNK